MANSPEKKPQQGNQESVSDSWVTLLIIVVLFCACLTAWWLARGETVTGAPGAPIGALPTTDFYEAG